MERILNRDDEPIIADKPDWYKVAVSIVNIENGGTTVLDWSDCGLGPSSNWMVVQHSNRWWYGCETISNKRRTHTTRIARDFDIYGRSGNFPVTKPEDCSSPLFFYTLVKTLLLNNNLIQEFPHVVYLRNVTKLDISGNRFQFLPDQLYQLRHLKTFRAHDNPIFSIQEVHMKKFVELDEFTFDPTPLQTFLAQYTDVDTEGESLIMSGDEKKININYLRKFSKRIPDLTAAVLLSDNTGTSVPLHTKLYRSFRFDNLVGEPIVTQDLTIFASLIRELPSIHTEASEVKSLGDGTYSISFELHKSGQYQLFVRLSSRLVLTIPILCNETSACAFKWGTGGGDSLHYEPIVTPQPMESLGSITIKRISSSDHHTVFISGTGVTYGYGDNSKGQLGHPKEKTWIVNAEPTPRVTRAGLEVSCGKTSTSILVEGGDVFSFGDGRHDMVHIESLRRNRIVALTYAFGLQMALSAKGEVFSWSAASGQPSRDEYLMNHQVRQLSGTFSRLVAITNTGRTFECEYDHFRKRSTWKEEMQGHFVAQVASSRSMRIGLTDKGEVYTWHVQPGTTTTKITRVNFPNDVEISQIASGTYHYAALSSAGKLYMWGSGKSGQLGFGSTEDIIYPTLMSKIPQRIYSVLATGEETLAIVTPQQSQVGEDILPLLTSGQFSDVTIRTRDGQKIRAHKCPLLAELFSEKTDEEVDLDYNSCIVMRFLMYLYGGKVSLNTVEEEDEMLKQMARNFKFDDLLKELFVVVDGRPVQGFKVYKGIVDDKRFSDFEIHLVNDGSLVRIFPAHRALLTRGEYFKRVINSGMREATEGKIVVRDLEEQTILCLLQWIYSNEIEDLQVDTALDLLQAADEFSSEQRLKDICTALARQEMDEESVSYVLQIAITSNSGDLKAACIDLICSRHQLVEQTDTYKDLPEAVRLDIQRMVKKGQ
ncbi:hypothetical protein PROFUN_02008 [Planoprotostelium fungivorum]|uniref:BTB domain-containing protein n=1 Tax=Planoprotostelium fungivorum TaxID=1890364 RepID=A0A2P6NB37_9EUKA|nr:hypothetical protein PROFUN_02008 [Planoprotostelium fungivorum]